MSLGNKLGTLKVFERSTEMTRKLSVIFIISLLVVAFLAVSAFSTNDVRKNKIRESFPINEAPAVKLAGVEQGVSYAPVKDAYQSLGFDGSAASLSPGKTVGTTSYDYQHNCRMGRQIEWRGSQQVHMIWMKQTSFVVPGDRGTGYDVWDPGSGSFLFEGASDGGGCDVHPRLGSGNNYSGYVTMDVAPDGRAIIGNHHDEGAGLMATVFFDYDVANCYFTAYKYRIPDSTTTYYPDPLSEYGYSWPDMMYQIYNNDTITHVVAEQSKNGINPQMAVYFRRVGGPEAGAWDYPPMLYDTLNDISSVVAASRVSGKVAIVWLMNYPSVIGSGESLNRGGNQRVNDIYYMISNDAGANWGAKHNASKFDSSQSGWLGHGDCSALIDSKDILHVIWDGREYSPAGGGTWVNFYGSRLLHWDDVTDEVRTIKDANWSIADLDYPCVGGAWNEMSIVKMQISECDGKLYAMFVMYNDIFNGVIDDCHNANWTANEFYGTANGDLWIAVSDNDGYNWDVARNLTDSYTPRCDSTPPAGTKECDSDMWPSMSRYGMTTTGGTWTGVPIVDPSGSYSGNKYLDVVYINDKRPGGCVQDAGAWTTNPVKWFRVACVNPVPNPVLAFRPSIIDDPTWTKRTVEKDTTVKLENVGNAYLTFTSITPIKITGTSYDWLGITGAPAGISHLSPNYANMTIQLNKGGAYTSSTAVGFDGIVRFEGNFLGSPDTLKIHLIIADTVQQPVNVAIRTAKKRLVVSNAGNFGNNGALDSAMNFFNDCDTMNNINGANDNARIYLFEGSPFIMRIIGADTVIFSYFFNNDWLNNDGFRPIKGITVDSSKADYQYAYSGQYLTRDSLIGVESWYWAPLATDSSDFIIQKVKITNKTTSTISNMYMGEVMDWDIPSDTGVENGSAFDATRNLMYCFGAEYMADTGAYAQGSRGNDCILADQRVGGMAFYKGFKLPAASSADTFTTFQGAMTLTNADWTAPSGNYVPGQLWRKFQGFSGYETWQSTIPSMEDSLYQDLNMVFVFGQYSLDAAKSIGFIKILATGYQGANDLKATIDKAKAWIASRKSVIEAFGCCAKAGDANHDNKLNLSDVSYIINKLYRGGPDFPCRAEADANGDTKVNLSDVSYIINKLYRGGPECKCVE
jgi:hypothetical protein